MFCHYNEFLIFRKQKSCFRENWKFKISGDASGKEPACHCRRHRNVGSILGLGRSPGGGNGKPFQYPCLENSIDIGAWWATVHGVTKIQTWLNGWAYKILF